MADQTILKVNIQGLINDQLSVIVNTEVVRANSAEHDTLLAAHVANGVVVRSSVNFHVTRYTRLGDFGFFVLDQTTDTPDTGGGGDTGGGDTGGGDTGGGGTGGGDPPPSPSAFLFGVNLMPNADWSTQFPKTNLLFQMRDLFSGVRFGTWDDGRSMDVTQVLDGSGHLSHIAVDSILSGQAIRLIPLASPRPDTDIIVEYTGVRPDCPTGTVTVERINGSGRNEIVIRNPSSSDDAFRIDLVGVCNVYGIHMAASAAAFTAALAPFDGIRFMDFQKTNATRTNSNALLDVSAGRDIASFRDDASSIALCESIAPSNHSRWYCVPANVADGSLLTYVQGILDKSSPSVPVYIEHSNEVWNSQFPQATAFSATFDTNQRWHAQRTARIAKIVANLLATPTYTGRTVKTVLGAWSDGGGGVFWQEQLIDEITTWIAANPTLGAMPQVLSTAPYFGHSLPDNVSIFTDGTLTTAINTALSELDEARVIADAAGMELICYEGGPHITTNGGITVNRDSRMEAALLTYLRGVRTRCDGMFFYALGSKYHTSGSWGAVETVFDLNTPKMRAIAAFAAEVRAE